jgi:hypothetical protein
MNKKGYSQVLVGIAVIIVGIFIFAVLIPVVRNSLSDYNQPDITKEDIEESADKIVNTDSTEPIGQSESVDENTKSYSNSNFGFKVNYPTDWQFKEFEDQLLGKGVYFTSTDEYIAENIVIQIQDLSSQPMSLEEYNELSLNQAPQLVEEFELDSESDYTISGYDAKRIIYTGIQNELDMKWMTTYTIKDNNAYVIAYTGLTDSYDSYLPIANQIIDSFQFT